MGAERQGMAGNGCASQCGKETGDTIYTFALRCVFLRRRIFVGSAEYSLHIGTGSLFIGGMFYTSQAIVDAVNMCLENYKRIIEEVELQMKNKVRLFQLIALLLVLLLSAVACSVPEGSSAEN